MFKRVKKSVGIEINDSVIRILETVFYKDEWRVSGANEIRLVSGIVENGQIKDRKALIRSIKNAMSGARPEPIKSKIVHFALPDELLNIRVFKTELSIGKGIKQAVDKEYQRGQDGHSVSEDYSFKVIDTKQGSGYTQVSSVVLISSAKAYLSAWQNFFASMGLKLEFFDVGTLAIYRGFFEERQDYNLGFLSLDERRTKLSLFSRFGLEFEHAWPIGLRVIASDFDGSSEPAQAFFEERGLSSKDRSEELASLALEIKKGLSKAASHLVDGKGEVKGASLNIKKLIVCGDASNIIGIREYLSSLIPGVEFISGQARGFVDDTGARYAQVLGLALRAEDNIWEKSDPILACEGNSNTLEQGIKNGETRIIGFFSFLKKLIFFPVFILAFAFGIWLLSGTLSNTFENRKNEQQNENEKIVNTEENIQSDSASSTVPEKSESDMDSKAITQEIKSSEITKETKVETKQKFIIVNNDIGIPLNVRKGPGRNFPIIGEASEGSEQVLLEEKDGWYKIEWANEENAWVSAEYATKAE